MTYVDNEFLFTSGSVTEGHPDKIADQISNGVLDGVLREDPYGDFTWERAGKADVLREVAGLATALPA